ncbi:hypothetical protein EC843_1191, partial [Buttiauxella sp. JUb87]|uniref:hypothetical protein n=1 Tax=Buttiauxella sp. JUb87 TaxID=2485129 RepID=UPI0010E33B97
MSLMKNNNSNALCLLMIYTRRKLLVGQGNGYSVGKETLKKIHLKINKPVFVIHPAVLHYSAHKVF